jgi:hypothetical protein
MLHYFAMMFKCFDECLLLAGLFTLIILSLVYVELVTSLGLRLIKTAGARPICIVWLENQANIVRKS